jgi:hypothetical protein
MAANTSKGITYPTSGDSITPLETVFATMASTTNTALGAINAGTDITAGTLPIARGGTGGTTQATAAAALGVVPLSSYFAAGKNAIINGAFDVWQRTTTTNSTTSTGYWADRWRYTATGGSSKALTQSRESFTAGTAPVAGYESRSFLRVAVGTAGSGYTYEAVEQPIEDVRTYAGSTVTVSFWAKTTSSSINFTPKLTQYFGSGGSADVVVNGSSILVTNSWTRFTQTLTVPSVAGKTIVNTNSALIFAIVPNTLNTTYTLDLWGVQVEQGSVATSFSTASDTIAGEVALCQRYYYRVANSPTATCTVASGMRFSTTVAWAFVPFPATMRTAPTALETAGTVNVVTTTGLDSSSTLFGEASTNGARITCTTTAVAAAGVGAIIRLTGTAGTAYLGFSAEI